MNDSKITPASYEPGNPRHNAEVFLSLWGHEVLWVNEDGTVFEAGDSSGGNASFADLVECLGMTDRRNRLSDEDAHAAVAMLYHVTPAQKPTKTRRDDVLHLARTTGQKLGREIVKEVIDRYAPSFAKVRDDQLESLWRDLCDIEKSRG